MTIRANMDISNVGISWCNRTCSRSFCLLQCFYHRSQHYVERFASESDVTSGTAFTFSRTQMGLMMQGKSSDEATQMASLSAKGNVQIQATLVALKDVSGWTIWLGIGCIGFVLLFPYKTTALIQGPVSNYKTQAMFINESHEDSSIE